MDGAKLQAELPETKAELNRLKESLTVATPVVHKDLSLVSLVPKWSGSDSSISLEEFFSSIESACRMGRWKDRLRGDRISKSDGFSKTFLSRLPRASQTRSDVAEI